MNDLDERLRSVLTERAGEVRFSPEAVALAMHRGRRHVLLVRTGAAVAAVTVLAGATVAAVALHGGGEQSLRTAAPAGTATLSVAAFPLTPSYVPVGLTVRRTSIPDGSTGQQTVTYAPAHPQQLRQDQRCVPSATSDSLSISVAADRVGPEQVGAPLAIRVGGLAGVLYDGHTTCRETTVVFRRAAGQWVTVTGDVRYADVSTLLRVATSLQDRPQAAAPPFVLGSVPTGYRNLYQYDASTMVLRRDGVTDPLSGFDAGKGVIVSLSQSVPHVPLGPARGAREITVGDRRGWLQGHGELLVRLQATTYLLVVSDTVPEDQLVMLAAHTTVQPAAEPLRGAFATFGG